MWYDWEHAIAARPQAKDGPQAGGAPQADEKTPAPTGSQLIATGATGDQLCQDLDFKPDVIKIDVEGHETQVLAGLRQTLALYQPLIFLELHPDLLLAHGSSTQQIAKLVAESGYQVADAYGEQVSVDTLEQLRDIHRFVLSPARSSITASDPEPIEPIAETA
jgi:hypothetical protein